MLPIATLTKVNTSLTRKMEWARLLGKAVTSIVVATKMTSDTDMVKCTGQMEAVTKVNGKTVSSMVLVEWNSLTEELKRATSKTTFTRNPLLTLLP
jgi:hypothetical protein